MTYTAPLLPSGSRIALLLGGPGSEREISLRTAGCVATALRACGHEVVEIDARDATFELPAGITLAYIAIHGSFGEDGELQAELERRGVPYTGAGVAASRLAFDKLASKRRFVEAGVPTPAFEVVRGGGAPPAQTLPLVLKPLREGSSVGVHIVREAAALPAACDDVFRYGDEALCEAFIEGRELTVGILGDQALPVVEIRPRSGFYDLANKYPWMNTGGGTDYFCPADIGDAATAAVQAAALAAHRALGIEVYSRVDVLLDAAGRPWVLEANTIPGMTDSSLLPKAAAVVGIPFPQLCLEIASRSLAVRRGAIARTQP